MQFRLADLDCEGRHVAETFRQILPITTNVMDDQQTQQQLIEDACAGIRSNAKAAFRRALLSCLSVGVGGAAVFGLVNSLAQPVEQTPAVAINRSDSETGQLPQIPQLRSVPTHITRSTRHKAAPSKIRPVAYQIEPAEGWQQPSTDPQIPAWAQPLPRDQANSAGGNRYEAALPQRAADPISEPVSIPRTADRTHSTVPHFPSVSTMDNLSSSNFSFKFKAAPWPDVVRQFATRAGYQLRIESVPTGTFDLYDTHQYSPVEALDLINGYLIRNGHLLVRNGKSLTLISTRNGIPHNLVPAISLSQLDQFGNNEVVSVAMAVPRSTKDLAATLKPLLGTLGTAIPVPGTRQMLVTDTTAGIRRLQSVLTTHSSAPKQQFGQVYQLRNSSAVDIAKALNELFGGGKAAATTATNPAAAPVNPMSSRVIIVPESQTNSLLINAPTEMLHDIYRMIVQLDRVPQQVVIQALLVEVDLGNTHEVGVEVGVQDSVLFDRSVIDNLVTLTETISNPATGIQTTTERVVSQTAAPGFNFNGQSLGNNTAINPASVGNQALSNLGVGRVNGDLGFGGLVLSAGSESINVLLRALQANYQTDVLSAPQVQTTNHHKGQIQIGQLVPVVEGVALTPLGSANPVIRQDKAGLILDVTPHIHADGSVLIDVMAEKSQFRTDQTNSPVLFFDATNGNAIRAPIKDITNAITQVSIRSGQTIVLGGMITKDMTVVERKVPILGNIPILGHAFRYDLDQTRRKELLIFLTPRIVETQADAEAIKNETIGRHHFPLESAWDIYGPLSNQYDGGPADGYLPGIDDVIVPVPITDDTFPQPITPSAPMFVPPVAAPRTAPSMQRGGLIQPGVTSSQATGFRS